MPQQENPVTRKQKLLGWIESRTGMNLILRVSLDEPIPGGARWAYVFGSGLLFIFISQVITGICLALYYVPSAQNAHVTVAYITKRVAAGEFLRSLHVYGASAMIIVLALHFLQTFLWGAYKGRRELLWAAGGVLAILVLAMGFTGYLLPWDQKAYFATAVATNIVSTIPVFGSWMAHLMRGGDTIGTLTLSRFYLMHVIILPALLFAFVAVHIYLFRKAGAAGPIKEDPVEPKLPPESFYPKQVILDLIFSMLLVSGLGFLSYFHPVTLGPRANPASTTFIARPEWYYLPIFEWLKFWEGPATVFGVVIFPALVALLFFLLPFLDRKLERRPWRRPIPLLAVSILFGGLLYLGYLSHYQDMQNPIIRNQLMQQAAQEKAYTRTPFQPFVQSPGSINLLAPATFNPTVAKGKALFQQNGCSGCHGDRGRGAVGPSLVGIGKKYSQDALLALIHKPSAAIRKAGMPGAPDLPIPEVKDLVAYLNALGTPEENVQPAMSALTSSAANTQTPPAGGAVPLTLAVAARPVSSSAGGAAAALIAQGRQLFQAHTCATCHGATAQGTTIAPPLAGIGHYFSKGTFSSLIHHPNTQMTAKGMPPAPLSLKETSALWTYLNSMPAPAQRQPGVPAVVIFKNTETALARQASSAPASSSAAAISTQQHVAASRPQPREVAASAVNEPAGDIVAGRAIFQSHTCATCHGPTAQGTAIAPPLAGIGRYFSRKEFSSLIHHPNAQMTAKGMPPALLSDQQTENLWAYLNSMSVPAHNATGVPPVVIFKASSSKPSQPSTPSHAIVAARPESSGSAAAKSSATLALPKRKVMVNQSALNGPAAAGEQIFESHGCIACHGEGGVGTKLAIPLIGITRTVSHDKLITLIRHPDSRMKAGGMPTFGFDDTQLNDVVSYLATLKKSARGEATTITAAFKHTPHKLSPLEEAGKSVYFQQRCSTCHGNGGIEGTVAAPSLTATASELPPSMIEHLLLHPSQAMQSRGMPPIDLNKADMKALIAFVRSLRYNR
uniref:C-type cytochrome n=1 Tax=Acidobacterium capsulatum TaxID=33075 RepID=A0A7V4XR30_9BACT